jgi:hypothetical protein
MSYATLRTIHGVLALALAALLALYALSGWLIIHRAGSGTPQERTLLIPAPSIGGEGEELARVREAAIGAAARAGLAGARIQQAKFGDGAWRVTLTRIARSAEVTLTPGAAEAHVALRDAALGEGVKRLHRVNAKSAAGGGQLAWVLLIDALSLALLLFALTGAWMFLRLKRDRRLGFSLLGASTLYTLCGIAWLALSR